MVIISSRFEKLTRVNYVLRLIAGFVWLGTFFRRLTPNYGDFEERIVGMAKGSTLLPDAIMNAAVEYWIVIYFLVISLEFISSISLLVGAFSRGGALLATVNGFGIGMAGLGLGIIDLIIPWSVAMITLYLLLFTHPGYYKGLDEKLKDKNLPQVLMKLM